MPAELTRSMIYAQSKPFDIQLRDQSKALPLDPGFLPHAPMERPGDLRIKRDLDKRVTFGDQDKGAKEQGPPPAAQGSASQGSIPVFEKGNKGAADKQADKQDKAPAADKPGAVDQGKDPKAAQNPGAPDNQGKPDEKDKELGKKEHDGDFEKERGLFKV